MKNTMDTAFQKMIWKQIKKILKGKISTYREIAIKIGNLKAYLAVAKADTKNLKILTIP
tara:strand:+ start:808 stop:984 length:177 start_codon:yes stop_codon:yes gene_type:complete